ncbi:MAG: hypothetical protein CMO55_07515 [Verrucomicrobiales bacterium]|nr:hypothetical protein [Verrucomicrobiales bacterium]
MDEEFLRRACLILRRIHSRASFVEVANEILRCAVQSSNSHHGSFVRVDWNTRKLKIVATAGKVWTPERADLQLGVGKGITGYVAESGETYSSDDVRTDVHYVPVLETVVSELAIPVKVDGRVWGIINLDSDKVGHYNRTTILRMELLAEMVASAIEFRLQTERERNLTASLAEAEKLSTMGHLVAGIAHEVNNPLASILGCAELFSGSTGNTEVDRSMEVIRQQAKRAGDLVKQLLSFARVRRPEDLATASMNKVVRESLDLVSPVIRLSSVSLKSNLPEEDVLCRMNSTQIQQILLNLLTNAEQAIQEAGVTGGEVSVSLKTTETHCHIHIRDNGPGIDERTQAKIFEPFFTTKETGKGTGLGLSISKDIAHFHGGDLVCESKVGEGCQFTLSVPLCQQSDAAETGEGSATVIQQSRSPRGNIHPRVLIVDDEAPIRWMLKRLFTPLARTLKIAGSAEEGLAFAEGNEFDLVISDFHLPGIDGIEMFHQLAHMNIKRFILITGDSSSSRINRFRGLENVAVMEKPFELEELVEQALQDLDLPAAQDPLALSS